MSVAGLTTAQAADTVLEFTPSTSTYTNSAAPKKVYSGSSDTVVSASQYATYLKFDTSKIPANSTIVSAELKVRVTTSQAKKPALWVASAATSWADPSMTYAKMAYESRPATTSGALNPGEKATASAGKTITTKLTGLAKSKRQTSLGFRIGYTTAGSALHLSKAVKPVLRLSVRPISTPTPSPSTTTPPSTDLPYAVAGPQSSTKKVFAHYFTPYPISIDNKQPSADYYATNYLSPSGENNKFLATGGLLRDRPIGRAPITGDFELADAKTEVKQASAAGIDGFVVDIMTWNGNIWDRALQMTKAAQQSGTGFVTVPMVDGSSAAVDVSAETMANKLALFFNTPGAYRMPDGRYMLSTFLAEGKPASYWKDVIAELKNDHGINVNLVAVFNSLTDARITEYAPISYGMGIWGARSANAVQSMPDREGQVRALGKKWMAPIAVQDVRHRTTSFAESENTSLLRASWKRAIDHGADMVQMVTWNDYSESTSFAPSSAHGKSFLDVNGYYSNQFKTGKTPTLTGDELVLTHRIQKTTTQPSKQSAAMDPTLAGSNVTPRNTAEVVSILKAPATVSLTVGTSTTSYAAPAGLSTYTVPLGTGVISAKAVRGTTTVKTVTSPDPVVSSIDYWDLQYYGSSSRENPTK